MGTWTWKQPSGKTYKVKSDYRKGTILVYNENNELIMNKKNLNEEAIKLIESNFLELIGKKKNRKKILNNNSRTCS